MKGRLACRTCVIFAYFRGTEASASCVRVLQAKEVGFSIPVVSYFCQTMDVDFLGRFLQKKKARVAFSFAQFANV